MTPILVDLRRIAASHSLFAPTTLRDAIERLGFVQADPIRAPARAQDLILRHRVENYRAGDLEQHYAELDLEEDLFYVYGFLPAKTWRLLHPRSFGDGLSDLEQRIVEAFEAEGSLDSRTLEERFAAGRGMNPWGSYSRATQLALDHLHHRGLLRVAGRDRGNRIYALMTASNDALPASLRLRELVLIAANLLAPLPRQSLNEVAGRIRRSMRTTEVTAAATIAALLRDGLLEEHVVEGLRYILLPGMQPGDASTAVRFLAPFDPVVWDRRRFEQLWGWAYRFEGYTPVAKRLRGYYAMPLLWRDEVIGWANVSAAKNRLDVDLGFVDSRPNDPAFERELDAEVERLRIFLQPNNENAAADT